MLQLTTSKKEKEVFQDKAEVSRNELLWPLSEEEKVAAEALKAGVGLLATVDQVGNSKATKDDKVPIKTERWNKFLYLGLDEEIREDIGNCG